MIDYRYNEDKLLEEIKQYIDSTYGQHYSQNKFQATEFIIDGDMVKDSVPEIF